MGSSGQDHVTKVNRPNLHFDRGLPLVCVLSFSLVYYVVLAVLGNIANKTQSQADLDTLVSWLFSLSTAFAISLVMRLFLGLYLRDSRLTWRTFWIGLGSVAVTTLICLLFNDVTFSGQTGVPIHRGLLFVIVSVSIVVLAVAIGGQPAERPELANND